MAAALRATHLTWGLPGLLEEAMPVRVALRMIDPATGAIRLDPAFFNYPSLAIYLHLACIEAVHAVGRLLGHHASMADFLLSFEADPTPVIVAARALHAAADVATVWAVFRIARRFSPRAGWIAAALGACSAVLIRTASTVIVDTLAAALLAWSLERLLAWQDTRRTRTLVATALLLGLAASTKYPAAAVAVPLLAGVAVCRPPRRGRLSLLVLGVAALAFAATSPYVVLDAQAALRDILYERAHMEHGHLGTAGATSLGFHLRNLSVSIGPLGVLLLALSPLLAISPAQRPRTVPLLLTLACVLAPIVVVRYDAERYLAPALPAAIVLVAAASAAAVAWLGPRGHLALRVGLVAGLVVPVALAGLDVAASGTDSTQARALAWCRGNVPADAWIAAEAWTAPLASVGRKQDLAGEAVYRHAGVAARARIDSLRAWRVVAIPVRVTGAIDVPGPAGAGRVPAVDLNSSYYVPALYAGADFVMTSGAIRGRYAADPHRFAGAMRFYALLERSARRAATFAPSRAVAGPEIRVYRITPRCRAELAREPLDPAWWTGWMPAGARLGPEPPWTREVYRRHFAGFARELAYAHIARGDTATAERLMAGAVAADSADATAALALSVCLGARDAWAEAGRVLRRALVAPSGLETLVLLRLARVEARLGDPGRQRSHLLEVCRREPKGSAIRAEAERDLERLATGSTS